jgi:hypothetical protein
MNGRPAQTTRSSFSAALTPGINGGMDVTTVARRDHTERLVMSPSNRPFDLLARSHLPRRNQRQSGRCLHVPHRCHNVGVSAQLGVVDMRCKTVDS